MKPELVVVNDLPPAENLTALGERYTLHRLWQAEDRGRLLADVAPRVRGIVTTGADGASGDLIRAVPNAEIIAIYGVGFDAVDVDTAKAVGVRVTNTPDVLTDDVADLAIALTLALVRRVVLADRFVREARWGRESFPLSRKLTGQRVGVIGMGRMGRVVGRRLSGFDVEVAYHDVAAQDVPYTFYDDLVALADFAQVLIVAAAGGASSQGLVGRAVLDALGPDGVLINVARGSIVDEPALVAALAEGTLGGAGLDVFADEPRVPQELIGRSDVVLTPHIASGTVETRRAMGRLVIENLDAHFAGRPLLTPVI